MTRTQRRVALLVAACFFMEMLDGTIVVTAAPRIASSLGVATTAIGLVITAYLVTLAVLIPASGWVSARFGARPVFLAAIAVFTFASLGCALSESLPMLVAMRVLQGVGGAMMVPVGRLIVLAATPKEELMRVVSFLVWPALIAPSSPAGRRHPHLGLSWHWIFLVNLPLGAVAFALALRLVESPLQPRPGHFDRRGVLLTGLGLACLTYLASVVAEPRPAWVLAAALAAATVLLLTTAIRHLVRARDPLVHLSILRIATFAASIGGSALFWLACGAAPFLLPLLFQESFGRARIIGQVGNRDSTEIKIVHGDPPVAMERRSASGPRSAELRILRELERDGFDLAPRVVAESGRGATYSWLDGSPLPVDELGHDDLVEWTGRAATLLSQLQQETRLEDGSVVVHGDFWLGNLLVRGTEITGLVDWGDARRGSAEVDRRFLIESLVRRLDIAPRLAHRLTDVRDAVLPGRATPDPAAYVLGEHAHLVTLPAHVTVHRVVGLPSREVLLDRAAEWARTEPTAPVLLPSSRGATRLLCELRAGLVERGLLVPELRRSPAEVSSESVGYHAFVDHEGTVIADFVTRHDVDADAIEVSRRSDFVAEGRAAVHDGALRGPVTVWLDDGGGAPSMLGVDACLGLWSAVGAEAGMDIAGLAYADLAGIARPRLELRPGLYTPPITTLHDRPSPPGGRATTPPAAPSGRPAEPDRGGDPS